MGFQMHLRNLVKYWQGGRVTSSMPRNIGGRIRLLSRAPLILLALSLLAGVANAEPAKKPKDGDDVLAQYLENNQDQRTKLRDISMTVDIEAKLPDLEKKGVLQALRKVSRLGKITYKVLGFEGDNMVKKDVIARYIEAEVKSSDLKTRDTLAINSDNYKFNYWGRYATDDWVLHLDNPTTYFVGGWTVDESEASWGKQTITSNDPAFLGQMAGQKMAILLFTITDGGGATAAQKEEVFFDDVKLTACYEEVKAGGEIFLPALMRKFGVSAGPICIPPNENPLDLFHSFRGLVQTNATCNSTLSFVDRADYYTFKPEKDGPHTLHLTNLPDETEWSAMIFTDTPSPDYAPGGASDGKCRITTPGRVDKQVTCELNKGSDYFVKVSSGSTPVAGSYTMRITAP